MAEAFGRWLEEVLGPRGLIVYDASDPAAKPLVAGVFSRSSNTRARPRAWRLEPGALCRNAVITRR
jgi:hypothetical protein